MKRKNALLFAVLFALGLALLITMIAYLNSPAMDYDYITTPEYAAQTLLNFKDELRRHRAFETSPPLNKGQNAREE